MRKGGTITTALQPNRSAASRSATPDYWHTKCCPSGTAAPTRPGAVSLQSSHQHPVHRGLPSSTYPRRLTSARTRGSSASDLSAPVPSPRTRSGARVGPVSRCPPARARRASGSRRPRSRRRRGRRSASRKARPRSCAAAAARGVPWAGLRSAVRL